MNIIIQAKQTDLFSVIHVHEEPSRGSGMTLITRYLCIITRWHEFLKSLYFLHRLLNAELFSTSADFWFCFSGCKPEYGREKWAVALGSLKQF